MKPTASKAAPPIVSFTERVLKLGLSPYQRVLLMASRADQYPSPSADELAIYTEATGRSAWPSKRPWLTVVVAGIRSGKGSRIGAPLAIWEALYGQHAQGAHVAPGETIAIPIVAQDFKASAIMAGFIRAGLKRIGTGFQIVTDELSETLRLSTGIEFRRYPPSPKALRGLAAPFWILDEAAHLPRVGAASSDEELFEVLRGRQLSFADQAHALIITSPWDRSGVVWDIYSKHFGDQGDPDILVWRAPTWLMNPAAKIERERRLLSPAVFAREIGAEFADSIEGFLSGALLDAAVDVGVTERPAQRRIEYRAAVDVSGGRHDVFTVSIAHTEGSTIVLDLVKGWTAGDFKRLKTRGVVRECAAVLARYGVRTATGDRYAGSTFPDLFAEAGIAYRTPTVPVRERGRIRNVHADRTAIYTAFEEILTDGRVLLVDHDVMLRQFRRLERRYSGDRATIDHPSGGSDDYANAAALAVFVAEQRLSREARERRTDSDDPRSPFDRELTARLDAAVNDFLRAGGTQEQLDTFGYSNIDECDDATEPEAERVLAYLDEYRMGHRGETLADRMQRAGLLAYD